MEDQTNKDENSKNGEVKVNVRVPKRVVHCSDGVLEEYSDDEVDEVDELQPPVDPKTLQWLPWFQHYAIAGGNKALEYCDYLGEGLADFLGITTPKYQLEISEYMRMEAAKKKLAEETASWTGGNNDVSLVTMQPSVAAATTTPTTTPETKPVVL